MNNLPVSNIDYKKLFKYLVLILVLFGGTYYIFSRVMDQLSPTPVKTVETIDQKDVFYNGRVKYLSDRTRESEGIKFFLADDSGKEIYLLKSQDDKLTLVENHNVKIHGSIGKTDDGSKEVLIVDTVVLSGGSDVTN